MNEIILEIKRNDMRTLLDALNAHGAALAEVGTVASTRKAKQVAKLVRSVEQAQQRQTLPMLPAQKESVLGWLSQQGIRAEVERFVRREQGGEGEAQLADVVWRINFLSRAWRQMIYQRCDAKVGAQ